MFGRIVMPSYLGPSHPRNIATQVIWLCYVGGGVEGGAAMG
jgi:hypothetical protein